MLGGISTVSPTELSEDEKALLKGYLVLAHAVIEEHIEDAVLEYLRRVVSWLTDTNIPANSARLVAAVARGAKTSKGDSLEDIGKTAEHKVADAIRANHGIKLSNLTTLVESVGIDASLFEAELAIALADLNTLGSKRGEAGHLSPYTPKAIEITNVHYPADARAWVEAASNAALEIDSYLISMSRVGVPRSLVTDWDGN